MQTNIDFANPVKTICWILSLLSWLLFLVSGWLGFFRLIIIKYDDSLYSYNYIWSFINIFNKNIKGKNEDPLSQIYLPIQAKREYYIILFLILLVLGTIGFILYIFKSIIKKDDHVFEGMMGNFSRYHFIPLTCASALFLQGYVEKMSFNTFNNEAELNKLLTDYSIFLTFSLIGLLSLIFIKMQTKIENPFYIVYSIKDGVYSFLIALFTYCLFYSAIYIGIINKSKKLKNLESTDINEFKRKCDFFFSICIGIINLSVGFFLKDFVIPVINLIIYLGLTVRFFGLDKKIREFFKASNGEGVIDVIMIFLSVACFGLLGFKKIK